MDNFQSLVLLNMVDCIGSVRIRKLLEAFGEPRSIFQASLHELSNSGILTPFMASKVFGAKNSFSVEKEIQAARDQGVRIMTISDADYPSLLKEIYDPPVVLYVKGGFIPADVNAVGVVGSRGASFYGLSCAGEFSFKLAQCGLTIVSGMARGIDTASHRAALNAGGRTIAVLGSGLNNIYPPENEGLFAEIARTGAVISQFPLDTQPFAKNFPIRNRIISGLSRGVLVVEASVQSGALITARYALEQDRQVFAIPGKLTSETSCGTNDLIKQGAKMVTDPQEVVLELCPNFTFEENGGPEGAPESQESSILRTLSDEPKTMDLICQEAGLSISDIASTLVQLELKGVIRQLPGSLFVKPPFQRMQN